MRSKNIDMVNGPLAKGVFSFALTLGLTNLMTLLFNAADLIVVGQFCGSKTVAAVGASGSLVALIVNFFIGFSTGAGVVVAQRYGAKNEKAVNRAVHTIIPTAFVVGLFLTVVGVCISRKALVWMDTPKDILGYATTYLRIYFAGILFRMVYIFGFAVLRATGDSTSSLKYLTLGGILNVIFNLFFVAVLGMNVDGVAYGTLISEICASTLCMRKLMKRNDCVKFEIKKICYEKRTMSEAFRIGIPAGVQAALFAFSNVLIQASANSFGTEVLTGGAAAASIINFAGTLMAAYQTTATNFMGQNIGARNIKRAKKVPWVCIGCMAGIGVVLNVFVKIFQNELLSIYITDSPQSFKWGIIRFNYMFTTYVICEAMGVMTGSLRGMGKSFVPMVITLVGACGLRILWIYTVFAKHHTYQMLLLSYPITWTITVAAEIIAYFIISRKIYAQIEQRLKEKEALKEKKALS